MSYESKKIDLMSAFDSVDINDLYFLFNVKSNITNKTVKYNYDSDYTSLRYDVGSFDIEYTIDINDLLLCELTTTKTQWGTYNEHIDITNNKTYPLPIAFKSSNHEKEARIPDGDPFYGLPVSFKDFVKQILGEDVKTENGKITYRNARKLLKRIKEKLNNKEPIVLSFDKFDAAIQLKENFGIYTNTIYDDKDVFEKISEIKKLAFEYSEVFGSFLKEKIDEVIKKYEISLEKNRPKFKIPDRNPMIELKFTQISPKQQLILDLVDLEKSIIEEINIIKYLNIIMQIKNVLEGKEVKENSELIDIAKSIYNNSHYLPNDKKHLMVDVLMLVTNEININKRKLDEYINNHSKEIQLEDTTQTSTFKTDFKALKDEIKESAEKYKKFALFKEALTNESNSFLGKKTLVDFVISINYVLTKIPNNIQNKKVIDKWETICEKYTGIVNDILNQKTKMSFEELENQFIEEINPFLHQLNFANSKEIDSYSLIYQIERSLDYIDGKLKNEKFNKEPITSLVKDLMDIANTKDYMYEREQIKSKVKDVLNEYLELLKKATITKSEQYKLCRSIILKKLTYILLYLKFFPLEEKDYAKKNEVNLR